SVRGVHVQIATVPPRCGAKRSIGESLHTSSLRRYEINLCLVRRHALGPDVGYPDPQLPRAGQYNSGKIGGSGVGGANRERTLVSPTPPAKTLGILNADVQSRALFFAGVLERDSEPSSIHRDFKRNLDIGIVLIAFHGPAQRQVGLLG